MTTNNKYTTSPRIAQALHTGVISNEQATLLHNYFNVCEYHQVEARNALMTNALFNAMRAIDNMPSEKPPEQLKGEFYIRKYKREQAQDDFLECDPAFDISFANPKKRLQHNAELISTAKLNFAIAQVKNALRYALHQPALLSCQLSNHPCFPLLFRQAQRHQSSDNLIDQLVNSTSPHSQLHELADQLKVALPVLAASFENQSGLSEVWLKACLSLLKHPLPYALLNNLQAQPFSAQVLASYQSPVAKQQARRAKAGNKLTCLGCLLCRVRSCFFLRGLFNKKQKLKQA